MRKTFVIEPQSYVITFTAQVTDGGKAINPVLQWGPGLGDTIHVAGQNRSFGTYLQFSQGIVYADGKVAAPAAGRRAAAADVAGRLPVCRHRRSLFPRQPGAPRRRAHHVSARDRADAGPTDAAARDDGVRGAPRQAADGRRACSSGRRTSTCCAPSIRDLVRTIYYGIFAFLAVPLLHALKWINGFVGNYGWSIIILTFLINVLMFPLKHTQRRLDAEDAGAAAAGEGDPGSLRQDEDDRSWASEDERRR